MKVKFVDNNYIIDCIAKKAREKGLNYGEYVKRYPEEVAEIEKLRGKPMKVFSICRTCGNRFEPPVLKTGLPRLNAATCESCLKNQKEKKAEKKYEIICKDCGKLSKVHSPRKVFCDECAILRRRQQNRKSKAKGKR